MVPAALFLWSCTSGNLQDYTTEGVVSPVGNCEQSPAEFVKGRSLGTVGQGACTVRDAWEITAIDGVQFSQPAIVTCAVAGRVRQWVNEVVQPAAKENYSSRITSLQIAASYSCRPRNGRSGAKLSEHGFGNALDVSGFTLANGEKITVEANHRSAFLRRIRDQACGLFHTVLGPGADSYHSDHLHLDLANRKSRQNYCH
jgi:hypothetical protein